MIILACVMATAMGSAAIALWLLEGHADRIACACERVADAVQGYEPDVPLNNNVEQALRRSGAEP